MKIIPYGRQWVDASDIREVTKILKSDWLTQGPKIKEFEDALCKYTGAKYAVAVSAKTGFPPQYNIEFAEATKVIGEVIASSPLFIFAARHAMCKAAVPLDTATAYLAPV